MLQVAQVAVCSQINTKHGFNPLNTKRRPLYLAFISSLFFPYYCHGDWAPRSSASLRSIDWAGKALKMEPTGFIVGYKLPTPDPIYIPAKAWSHASLWFVEIN